MHASSCRDPLRLQQRPHARSRDVRSPARWCPCCPGVACVPVPAAVGNSLARRPAARAQWHPMHWAQAARGPVSFAQPSSAAGCCRSRRQRLLRLVPTFPSRMYRQAPRSPRGPVIRPDPPPPPPPPAPPPPPLREQHPCQSNSRCCFRNFWTLCHVVAATTAATSPHLPGIRFSQRVLSPAGQRWGC